MSVSLLLAGLEGVTTASIKIMVGFFILNIVGEFFVTKLILHPFAGAWFPDVILLIITIILFYRASRH